MARPLGSHPADCRSLLLNHLITWHTWHIWTPQCMESILSSSSYAVHIVKFFLWTPSGRGSWCAEHVQLCVWSAGQCERSIGIGRALIAKQYSVPKAHDLRIDLSEGASSSSLKFNESALLALEAQPEKRFGRCAKCNRLNVSIRRPVCALKTSPSSSLKRALKQVES